MALQSFENNISNTHVQILADNTTAIAYVNHMGGRQVELDTLARKIWTWCLQRGMWISATHLPGTENVDADFESRHFNDRTEWSLNENIFTKIVKLFGAPDIDLFASRLNNKCDRYVSWHRDPHAEYVDAFSKSWHGIYSYIFPPFSLLGRCVQKIRQDKAQAVMVVPVWTTQAWFTNLLKLLIQEPVLLPRMDKIVLLPGSDKLHPLRKRLQLMVVRVSGEHSENKEFHERLQTLCSQPGGLEHINSTIRMSGGGISFALKGKLIECIRM